MNLLPGWQGMLWVPAYTIGALIEHIGGIRDITSEVMS